MVEIDVRIDECRRRWEAARGSRAFIPLADALRQAGRCDEALAVLEEGLAAHPRAVGALVTLARTLVAAGRPVDAADVAARVLEHDADNLVALEILGEHERGRGEFVAAITHYERLAQLDPGDEHWSTVLASVREERAAAAQAADGGGDEAGFATPTLVDLYLAQGYRQKALAMLQRLVAERPADAALRERLAVLADPERGAAGAAGAAAAPVLAMLETGPGPGEARPAGAPGPGDRREQSREQFAMWIERLRADRGAAT